MNSTVSLKGKIKYVVFKSADGRYSVLDFKTDNGRIKATGYDMPESKLCEYIFNGEYKTHPVYGKTFVVNSCETIVPHESDMLIDYLSSGIYKGIGKKLATMLYKKYGEKVTDIIEHHTDELRCIKGISEKKLASIKESVSNNTYKKELMQLLSPYGITSDQCMRLAKKYGATTAEKIHENPYILQNDLKLMFKETDRIALKMGIENNSDVRMTAAFRHVINCGYEQGDTGVELQYFGNCTKRLLGSVSEKEIETSLIKKIKTHEYRLVTIDTSEGRKQYVITASMYNIEQEIAKCLVALAGGKKNKIDNINELIKKQEQKKGISLDDVQREAVKQVCTCPLTIITGGPGTGKTTIMDIATAVIEEATDETVQLLAPTGRAARKLAEATGHEASTIHSFLGLYNNEDMYEDKEVNEIENTLIIADEYSMADTLLTHVLLRRIGKDSRMAIVGDIDQLPSVGPGAILRDIIESNVAKVIKLEQIFRTNEDGNIYINSQRVNEGNNELSCGKDFIMHSVAGLTREELINRSRDLMIQLYKKRIGEFGIENVALLIPYRKDECGVTEMNMLIQEKINPSSVEKKEYKRGNTIYRVDDPVMHINTNTVSVSNGDIGIIKDIEIKSNEVIIYVQINNSIIKYGHDDLENLSLAYVTTVHKSQGSEAKAVITCITSIYKMMLYRNIPYVAFSRAKQVLDVIYDDGLNTAISVIMSNSRKTMLPYFLKREMSEFVAV